MTHHATEDLAILRTLPNMTVTAPGDPVEAALATQAAATSKGPFYLRLGKAGEPLVHQTTPQFQIGRAIIVRNGRDITLISTGGMLHNTVRAAEELAQQGIKAGVLSMHTLKPIDSSAILAAARETGVILTIEEHSIIGGLGGAVAEILSEAGGKITFARLGLNDAFCNQMGSQEYLRELHSLSIPGIVNKALQLLAAA